MPALALVLVVALTTAAAAQPQEITTWRTAIRYRTTFEADSAATGTLYVAAVDSFAVWFNGEPAGGDSVATRAAQIPVTVTEGDNDIAVQVVNHGGGKGHGMVALVVADSLRGARTTTDRSLQTWYWSTDPQADDSWAAGEVGEDDGWAIVQEGVFDLAAVTGLPTDDLTVVAAYPNGVDAGHAEGGLRLKEITGQNLARGTPANRIEVVDGDMSTSWDPPVNALNFTATLDLQVRRNIHTLRALTRPGRNESDLESNSLRGYSVQISDDQIRWSEVGVLRSITDFASTQVMFRPTWTRYIRLVVVDINAITQPRVAEVEVYGSGHTDRASYLSELLDFGLPDASKNFGRVYWDAVVPERTELTVQFRAGDVAEDFTDEDRGWSDVFATTGDTIWYPAAEPARLFQYRVNMSTRDDTRTPVFRGLGVEASEDIAVGSAVGRVIPNAAPIGLDTTFVYTLDLAFGEGDRGVERLAIEVPSRAVLGEVDGLGTRSVAAWSSTQQSLEIRFDEPLTEDAQLTIPFRTRTYATAHSFRTALFGPQSTNPQNAGENTATDEDTGESYSWNLLADSAPKEALSLVQANPRVLTPNGDGRNDFTIIELVLAKINTATEVRIDIHDLSGRRVADLKQPSLIAGTYLADDASGPDSPGYWDGTDGAGNRVPPGIYVYRVEVQLDTGDEVMVGTVAVAY